MNKYLSILPKDEIYLKAKINLNLNHNYSDVSQVTKAFEIAKKTNQSLDQLVDSGFEDRFLIPYVLQTKNNLATNYSMIADNLSALKYTNEAIEIAKSNNSEDIYKYLLVSKVSNYLSDGQFNNALIQSKFALSEGCSRSDVYPIMADSYIYLDSVEKAKFYILDNKPAILSDEYYKSLSRYYLITGDTIKGIEIYKDLIKKMDVDSFRYERDYYKSIISYAQHLEKNNQNFEAAKSAHKVLNLRYPEVVTLDINSRPPISSNFPDNWIIQAMGIKADYFKNLYLETKDSKSLEEAKFYYDQLFTYFDRLKSSHNAIKSQALLGSDLQSTYAKVIDFYLELNKIMPSKNHVNSAFLLAQASNSFVLRNEVSIRRAMQIENIAAEDVDQYLTLASNAGSSDITITNNANPVSIFNSFKEDLFAKHPSLVKYQRAEAISISDIQAKLSSESILMKYFYYDYDLYCFIITKDDVITDQIALNDEFLELVKRNENYNSGTLTWNEEDYISTSKKIYDKILGKHLQSPSKGSKNQLIIVPDGPVKRISFSALITTNATSPIQTKDYLIGSHSISYLYYCSQLISNELESNNKDGFVGFGLEYEDEFLQEIITDYKRNDGLNENGNRSFSLKKLKYAIEEILNISELFNGNHFINKEATPQTVIENIKDYSIVHISAHALADLNNPLESSLILNTDQNSNYKLKYQDILNLNLNTDLVVLSACQTNLGEDIAGEGLSSLAKAFIQSGCKSSVGAYWEVPDKSTKDIMQLFYANLKQGENKAIALQQAQITYLNSESLSTPRTRTPQHWAPWTIYGPNDAIPVNKNYTFIKYGFLALGLLGLLFILMKYRKKEN